jgi:hypothetical protein
MQLITKGNGLPHGANQKERTCHMSVFKTNLLRVVIASSLTMLLLTPLAGATTRYWLVTSDGNWNTPANWTGGVVPGPSDSAGINTGATVTINCDANPGNFQLGDVSGGGFIYIADEDYSLTTGMMTIGDDAGVDQSDGDISAASLYIETWSTADSCYSLSGGELAVSVWMYVGQHGTDTDDDFVQSGGSVEATNLYVGAYRDADGAYSLSGTGTITTEFLMIGIGAGTNPPPGAGPGVGTFTQNGADTSVSVTVHPLVLGGYWGDDAGDLSREGDGTYNLQDGTLTGERAIVGEDYEGEFNQSGGTADFDDSVFIGHRSGATGTYTLSSGDLDINDDDTVGTAYGLFVGKGGTGTFAISGGDLDVSDVYIGDASGSTGTFSLTGGSTTVSRSMEVGASSGTGRFEWFYNGTGAFSADELELGSNGTLAMGFDFDVDELKSGALFGSGTMTGLSTGKVEITNSATATFDTGSFEAGTLTIGDATDGAGRFEWFINSGADDLSVTTLSLASNGTLAMGFDFDLDELADGTLSDSTTVSGLASGTLEVTNDKTATHNDGSTIAVGDLVLGGSDGDGKMVITGTSTTLTAASITVANDADYNQSQMSKLDVQTNADVNVTADIDIGLATAFFQSSGTVDAVNMTVDGSPATHTGGTLTLTGDLTVTAGALYLLNMLTGTGDLAVTGDINITSTSVPSVGATFAWGSDNTALSADRIVLSGPTSGHMVAPALGIGFDFDLDELTDGTLFDDGNGSTLVGLDGGALVIINGATLTHDTGTEAIKIVKIGLAQTGAAPTYEISSTAALNTDYLMVAHSGSGTLEIQSTTADITVAELLHFGDGGSLSITSADGTITMDTADFDNRSTSDTNMAGLNNLALLFVGDATSYDLLEVACEDLGSSESGFSNNFALDQLLVGDATSGMVQLVDAFDNSTGDDALYVDYLFVDADSTFDFNDIMVYCHSYEFETGSTIIGSSGYLEIVGGGRMAPVPEPATMGLLALGALGMLKRRRR